MRDDAWVDVDHSIRAKYGYTIADQITPGPGNHPIKRQCPGAIQLAASQHYRSTKREVGTKY